MSSDPAGRPETMYAAVLLQLGLYKYMAVLRKPTGYILRVTDVTSSGRSTDKELPATGFFDSVRAAELYAVKVTLTQINNKSFAPVFLLLPTKVGSNHIQKALDQHKTASVMSREAWCETDIGVSEKVILSCWDHCPVWFKNSVTNIRDNSGRLVAFNAGNDNTPSITTTSLAAKQKLRLFKHTNTHMFGDPDYKG